MSFITKCMDTENHVLYIYMYLTTVNIPFKEPFPLSYSIWIE